MAKANRERWWQQVTTGIANAVKIGKRSFYEPGSVLGAKTDDDNKIVGFIVRDKSRTPRFIPIGKLKRPLDVGSKVDMNFDKYETHEEPEMVSFIYGAISNQVKLLPKLWLHKIIKKLLNGEPITEDDFKPFDQWVKLPVELKQDEELIELLYRAANYGGLEFLSKFNFLFKKYGEV